MIDLTAEQRQLAKIVHDYACRFPLTENGDAQLLQGCYDYMDAFKRVMDSASKVQMESLKCRKITKNLVPEISAVPA
ncbi:hypothetical protein LWN49_003966 [Salmonella enterica]|nr:hypothetical protein [Salmonella enterica]